MKSVNTKRRTAVKIVSVLAVLFVMAFAFSVPAFAGIEIEGDPDITIEADEVIEDDAFLAGQDILVEGTIIGDLFATGETVTITGTVEGNVFVSAALVQISGMVDGTVLIGSYSAEIQPGAVITRNIYFGGFSLEVQEEALIERSIYAGGYQVQLSGQVDRNVVAGAGAFAADGTIAGDLLLEVGDPDSDIPNIQFGDPIDEYEVDMLEPGLYLEDDVVGGDVDFRYTYMETDFDFDTNIDDTVSETVSFFFAQRLRRLGGEFLTVLLLGALALYVAKDWLIKAVDEIKANALRDTGTGLLIFLLYLPAVFVLFVALGAVVILGSVLTIGAFTGELIAFTGIGFTGLLAVFGLLVTFGTKIVFSYLVGRLILERGSQFDFESYWHHFGALALGAFLYMVLRMIPVIGWLMMAILAVIGTGAFFFVLRDKFRKQPVEVTPA
jgi:cytoskeletal protein CcmA (bactofilin family)